MFTKKKPKSVKSFRLSENAIAILKALSKTHDISESQAVEDLILSHYKRGLAREKRSSGNDSV